jgi:hypothetical protein
LRCSLEKRFKGRRMHTPKLWRSHSRAHILARGCMHSALPDQALGLHRNFPRKCLYLTSQVLFCIFIKTCMKINIPWF